MSWEVSSRSGRESAAGRGRAGCESELCQADPGPCLGTAPLADTALAGAEDAAGCGNLLF